ncbi:MAG: hypothetical protein LKG31_01210 [Lactobacillus sp.]|jgi:opacity protein-like surface antigen|nr:hypothetical protein [Lactobacillus sp.]
MKISKIALASVSALALMSVATASVSAAGVDENSLPSSQDAIVSPVAKVSAQYGHGVRWYKVGSNQ